MSAGLTEGNSTDQESGSAGALNADAIAAVDINDFQAAYLQILGPFSGTVTFQGSNDNTNFVSVLATDISNPTQSPIVGTTIPGMFYIPTPFRYFRVRMTAYVSGAAAANAFFQRIISGDLGPRTVNAIQSGTWTVVANEDKNYGTVGANTLRSAAQIGNATGAADFNAGTTGVQTLRASVNITRNGTELSYNAGASDANTIRASVNLKREGTDLDYNFGAASANSLRTASLIGNATGAADFNAGALGAQTLRVCAILANAAGVVDYNYGTVGAQTIRSAAQVGNATGAADFNSGATGAQTLRTHANQGAPGTAANAWFEKITDGTNTAAVKAASTAAVAADPSLVVALSPNSPVPAGTNAIGTVTAVGNVAHAAADSGNPVKVGGKYNATPPALSDGQRSDLQMTADGKVKVDTSFSVLGGQLVPTITNKFRVRYSVVAATVTSAYTTLYTRSGTGLFFGFQADFNSAKVFLRITIDSGQIFEVTIEDLKLFQFNDTSATRMQAGSFWSTLGNTVDFSSKFPIPYTTSITIEMKRSDATNHTMNQYMVFLTEDT